MRIYDTERGAIRTLLDEAQALRRGLASLVPYVLPCQDEDALRVIQDAIAQ